MANKKLIASLMSILVGVVLVGTVFYLGLVQTLPEKENNSGEINFKRIIDGTQNSISEKQTRIIRSQNEWLKLWREMFPDQITISSTNFDEQELIALFQGEKSTAGYSINVEKIVNQVFYIEIIVKEISPGENCFLTQSITKPYSIVSLPRTDKEIRFSFKQEVISC